MRRQQRNILLLIFAVGVLAVVWAMSYWTNQAQVDAEAKDMTARFERVALLTRLDEAEAALGVSRGSISYNSSSRPETVKNEWVQSDVECSVTLYPGRHYGIELAYDPATKLVHGKKLIRLYSSSQFPWPW